MNLRMTGRPTTHRHDKKSSLSLDDEPTEKYNQNMAMSKQKTLYTRRQHKTQYSLKKHKGKTSEHESKKCKQKSKHTRFSDLKHKTKTTPFPSTSEARWRPAWSNLPSWPRWRSRSPRAREASGVREGERV